MCDNGLPVEMQGWDHVRIEAFRRDLLQWYDQHKRDLPWRKTQNPYYIWVSEIMLQQTQVATVIPYYERFIEILPTVEALALADEQILLNLWQGLGYYSRVRNMQAAARQIMQDFNGIMPQTLAELLSLKGIGPYTAAAIGSMAFGLVEPALDGNLFRIVARLFEIDADIGQPRSRKLFMSILYALIDPQRPGDFNQALMDLGATVMTATNPFPAEHPLAAYDAAYQHGTAANFPVKRKKVKQTAHQLMSYVVINAQGQWLMRQHQAGELLTGLWHFPLVEQSMIYEAASPSELLEPFFQYCDQAAIRLPDMSHWQHVSILPVGTVKHVFSHRIWQVDLFVASVSQPFEVPQDWIWVAPTDVGQLPISTLQQKLMKQIIMEDEAI